MCGRTHILQRQWCASDLHVPRLFLSRPAFHAGAVEAAATHVGADILTHAGAVEAAVTHAGADGADILTHVGADILTHAGAVEAAATHAGAVGADILTHAGTAEAAATHAGADTLLRSQQWPCSEPPFTQFIWSSCENDF